MRPGLRVHRFKDPLARLERHVKPAVSAGVRGPLSPWSRVRNSGAFFHLKRVLSAVLLWPDRFSGWAVAARRASLGQRPDVVFASGPPLTALMVGATLAKRYRAPWVADYRDLLAFGTYHDSGRLRRAVDQYIERRTVSGAAALLTVSSPLAADLSRAIGMDVDVVMNGYEPSEMPSPAPASTHGELVITYCGEIYHEKRDPTPLFRAMRSLRDQGVAVRAKFYGNSVGMVNNLARECGVADWVEVHARVSRAESLQLQADSDVLLLLMWNDPRENGVYTGKLFEYVGVGRPILMLGYEEGVAAQLVRDRRVGLVANDPAAIERALTSWVEQKSRGPLSTSKDAGVGLTRREQSTVLESVLQRVAR